MGSGKVSDTCVMGRLRRVGVRLLMMGTATLLALACLEAALWINGYPLGMYPEGLFVQDDRIGFYRLAPGFAGKAQTGEAVYGISVNASGTRGRSLSPGVAALRRRILGLGDSFAFGVGVEDDQTYLAQLQQLLNAGRAEDVQVMNAGVPGYGTIHQLRWLESFGLEQRPDVALLGFYAANDLSDNRDPAAVQAAQGVLVPRGRTEFIDLKIWLRRSFRTYGVLANALKRQPSLQRFGLARAADPGMAARYPGTVYYLKGGSSDAAAAWRRAQELLLQMRRQLQAHGARLVILAIPDRISIYEAWLRRAAHEAGVPPSALDPDQPERELARFCREQGIPLIQVAEPLRAAARTDPALYFHYDGHWTPVAHRIAAKQIAEVFHAHPEWLAE